MHVYNITRRDGSLSSITVADPGGYTASFAVEDGRPGPVLAHTPGVPEAWRREARAYADIMLATELEASPRTATA